MDERSSRDRVESYEPYPLGRADRVVAAAVAGITRFALRSAVVTMALKERFEQVQQRARRVLNEAAAIDARTCLAVREQGSEARQACGFKARFLAQDASEMALRALAALEKRPDVTALENSSWERFQARVDGEIALAMGIACTPVYDVLISVAESRVAHAEQMLDLARQSLHPSGC